MINEVSLFNTEFIFSRATNRGFANTSVFPWLTSKSTNSFGSELDALKEMHA